MPDDYPSASCPARTPARSKRRCGTCSAPAAATVAAWESFGNVWIQDAVKQLKLKDLQVLDAGYGEVPTSTQVPQDNDVVFTWNGTTAAPRSPNTDLARRRP